MPGQPLDRELHHVQRLTRRKQVAIRRGFLQIVGQLVTGYCKCMFPGVASHQGAAHAAAGQTGQDQPVVSPDACEKACGCGWLSARMRAGMIDLVRPCRLACTQQSTGSVSGAIPCVTGDAAVSCRIVSQPPNQESGPLIQSNAAACDRPATCAPAVQHIAHALGPHLLQLLKLVLLATTLTHYIACFFYVSACVRSRPPRLIS